MQRAASIVKAQAKAEARAAARAYPHWDKESGAVRHLVEPCGLGQCTNEAMGLLLENPSQDMLFNAYAPGRWDFSIASQVSLMTGQVYNSGDVLWSDALQAAIEGRPNPLSSAQFERGLIHDRDTPDDVSYSISHHLIFMAGSPQFNFLFLDQLGWSWEEVTNPSNYEPRYLEALVRSHPIEARAAYKQYLKWRAKHPDDPGGIDTDFIPPTTLE